MLGGRNKLETAYFRVDVQSSSGVDITFTRSRGMIRVGGWYDHMVGITPVDISLKEFFERIGITKKDCDRVFKGGV